MPFKTSPSTENPSKCNGRRRLRTILFLDFLIFWKKQDFYYYEKSVPYTGLDAVGTSAPADSLIGFPLDW